jgi:hypothetical protein
MHDFFDPTPEQQKIVLVDRVTVRKAEKLIERAGIVMRTAPSSRLIGFSTELQVEIRLWRITSWRCRRNVQSADMKFERKRWLSRQAELKRKTSPGPDSHSSELSFGHAPSDAFFPVPPDLSFHRLLRIVHGESRRHHAVIVLGCDAAVETVRSCLQSNHCRVTPGM